MAVKIACVAPAVMFVTVTEVSPASTGLPTIGGAGAQVDYVQFLVPGVFVITALQGAQQTSMGFAADLAEGVTDRFRSLPMSQFAVIAGRTLADAARNVIGLIMVASLALVMGYRFDSLWGAVAAIAVTTAIGFAFSWLGAAIAAKVRQPDMVGMLSMFWLFPLMLASTAFSSSRLRSRATDCLPRLSQTK